MSVHSPISGIAKDLMDGVDNAKGPDEITRLAATAMKSIVAQLDMAEIERCIEQGDASVADALAYAASCIARTMPADKGQNDASVMYDDE